MGVTEDEAVRREGTMVAGEIGDGAVEVVAEQEDGEEGREVINGCCWHIWNRNKVIRQGVELSPSVFAELGYS